MRISTEVDVATHMWIREDVRPYHVVQGKKKQVLEHLEDNLYIFPSLQE